MFPVQQKLNRPFSANVTCMWMFHYHSVDHTLGGQPTHSNVLALWRKLDLLTFVSV